MNIKYLMLAVLSIAILLLGTSYYLYQDYPRSLLNKFTKHAGTSINISTDTTTAEPIVESSNGVIKLPNTTLQIDLDHSIGILDTVATEITELSGLSEGATFVGGVHLDAYDAVLVAPGILKITIPEGIDTTKLAGFSFDDDGENFHLYPIEIVDGEAVLSLSHFSGYGIVLVEPTFPNPPVSGYEARVQQAIMNEILKLQRQQILGEIEDYGPIKTVVKTELEAWLKAIDSDYATPATNNIAMLEPALLEYVKALQIYQLIGQVYGVDLASEFEAIEQKLEQAIQNANNTAIKVCREQNDPDQAALLIRIFNLATLMFPGDFDEIVENAKACAQFTLLIETNVTEPDYLDGCALELNYNGEVPLTLDPEEAFALKGEGVVTGSIKLCNAVCTVTQGSLDQPINIPTVHIRPGNQANIRFMIEVPEAKVPLEWSCEQTYDGGSVAIGDLYEWAFTLLDTKLPMLTPEHFILEDWHMVKTGATYATQVYNGKVPGTDPFPIYIDTTYTLKHTPSK